MQCEPIFAESPMAELTPIQLRLLQESLANARFLAGEGAGSKTIYDVLDRLEALPTLVGSREDDDLQLFFETVIGLATIHPIFQSAALVARDFRLRWLAIPPSAVA